MKIRRIGNQQSDTEIDLDLDEMKDFLVFFNEEKQIGIITISPNDPTIKFWTCEDSQKNIFNPKFWTCEDSQKKILKPKNSLIGHKDEVTLIQLNGENELISSAKDGQIKIWSLEDKKIRKTYSHHEKAITALCLCKEKDTTKFVASSDEDQILLWEKDTGVIFSKIDANAGKIVSLGISGFKENEIIWIISGSEDGRVRTWPLSHGTLFMSPHYSTIKSIKCVKLKSESELSDIVYFVVLDQVGKIMIWKENGEFERSFNIKSNQAASKMEITTDGKWLIIFFLDKILVYSFPDFCKHAEIKMHFSKVCFVEGENLLSIDDHIIKQWDTKKLPSIDKPTKNLVDLEEFEKFFEEKPSTIIDLFAVPDKIFLGYSDGIIKVWSLEGKNFIKNFKEEKSPLLCLTGTTKNEKIIAAYQNKKLVIWSYLQEKEANITFSVDIPIRAMAVSLDDKKLIVGGLDGQILMIGGLDGKEIAKMLEIKPLKFNGESEFKITCFDRIASDGKNFFIFGGINGKIKIYHEKSLTNDCEDEYHEKSLTYDCEYEWWAHNQSITFIMTEKKHKHYSKNLIFSSSLDCIIKIWRWDINDNEIQKNNWLKK